MNTDPSEQQEEICETLVRLASLAGLPAEPEFWSGLKFQFIWADEKYESVLILGTIASAQITQLELVLYVSTPEFGRPQTGMASKLYYLKFVERTENKDPDPHWVAVVESEVGKEGAKEFRGSMKFFPTSK